MASHISVISNNMRICNKPVCNKSWFMIHSQFCEQDKCNLLCKYAVVVSEKSVAQINDFSVTPKINSEVTSNIQCNN